MNHYFWNVNLFVCNIWYAVLNWKFLPTSLKLNHALSRENCAWLFLPLGQVLNYELHYLVYWPPKDSLINKVKNQNTKIESIYVNSRICKSFQNRTFTLIDTLNSVELAVVWFILYDTFHMQFIWVMRRQLLHLWHGLRYKGYVALE